MDKDLHDNRATVHVEIKDKLNKLLEIMTENLYDLNESLEPKNMIFDLFKKFYIGDIGKSTTARKSPNKDNDKEIEEKKGRNDKKQNNEEENPMLFSENS